MPPDRLDLTKFCYSGTLRKTEAKPYQETTISRVTATEDSAKSSKSSDTESSHPGTHVIEYPTDKTSRAKYKTPSGKRLTPYQWKVYDYLLTIPRGRVTTYKGLSVAIGGSPRSAGAALRNNPFSPYIPCHRVVASDGFIGGFFGEWARGDVVQHRSDQKRAFLAEEGVLFDQRGHLCKPTQLLL